jgi:putative flippase GtrA|tara:strand:- start:793 stop:1299 length:507 start_codon:yes stop_codon:yes gene_type:complete
MGLMDVKLYMKAASVGVFSTGADILLMILLAEYTDLSLENQLYIGSGTSLTIAFFGHKLWTFKNKEKGWTMVKQIIIFLIYEILFILVITKFVIYITKPLDTALAEISPDTINNSWILTKFLEVEVDKDTKKETVKLRTLTNIIIKHIIIFIMFNLISLPVYKKLFNF